MRYRRLSARFLRSTTSPRAFPSEPAWGVAYLSLAPVRWRPAIDVCERGDALVVLVEIAGVQDDDIEVSLFADALVVEGERRLEACGTEGRYDRVEIREGPFRVEMGLPFPVDGDRVEAAYERGLLRVTLPRAQRVSGPMTEHQRR